MALAMVYPGSNALIRQLAIGDPRRPSQTSVPVLVAAAVARPTCATRLTYSCFASSRLLALSALTGCSPAPC
ncbi:hypothetical protein LY78DRAFT_654136 [Colletotrichum sublineola]|nr:hypothetical protein LY78DRAFT_654136 [Colletotrichum sublineola]